jgi:hypothetical protein
MLDETNVSNTGIKIAGTEEKIKNNFVFKCVLSRF